jgi:prepilin-type N-terminal cleavage/methylation domain-containing protein
MNGIHGFRAKSLRGRSRGFTLIELLVAVGLMVILISAVVLVFARSTQVFATAESLMKIFQNARAAMNIMGREIGSALPLDSENQKFIICNPRTGNSIRWKSEASSISSLTGSGVTLPPLVYQVTDPLLSFIGRTAWIDGTIIPAERVSGTAKIWYRLRRDQNGPFSNAVSSVTLERVLLTPNANNPSSSGTSTAFVPPTSVGNHLDGKAPGKKITIWSSDVCQYIRFDPGSNQAIIHFDYFDRQTNRFKTPAAGAKLRFDDSQASTELQQIPGKVRLRFQVIDNKSNEVRSLSREFLIPAGFSE